MLLLTLSPRSQEAICRYLASAYGYHTGAGDLLAEYKVNALAAVTEDISTAYLRAIYTKAEPAGCELLPFLEGPVAKALPQVEHILSKSEGDYFFADKPSYAEFTLFHM